MQQLQWMHPITQSFSTELDHVLHPIVADLWQRIEYTSSTSSLSRGTCNTAINFCNGGRDTAEEHGAANNWHLFIALTSNGVAQLKKIRRRGEDVSQCRVLITVEVYRQKVINLLDKTKKRRGYLIRLMIIVIASFASSDCNYYYTWCAVWSQLSSSHR